MQAVRVAQPDIDEPVAVVVEAAWLDALPTPAALLAIDCPHGPLRRSNEAMDRLRHGLDDEVDPLRQPALVGALAQVSRNGGSARRVACSAGAGFDHREFLADVTALDGTGCALVVLIEQTAVAKATRLLRRQMLDDPLTGLPNREGFVERLDALLAGGNDAHAIVAINLAHFSRVNDCMGALGGDELLVTVARRLKSGLRDGDVLARTGADEFALIVENIGEDEDVDDLARRVEAILAQPFRLSDFEIKVDAAIGCAHAQGCDDGEQAMRHAQLALKLAKATRRIEIYRPSALASARRRFLIETELRRAIEQEELSLAFQPLVDLGGGRVIGFEALARWTHSDLGAISPVEFITVAEESGLIVPLGRWVLDQALATLAAWDKRAGCKLPVYVAVNVSPIEVARDDVAARVREALGRHGIDGRRLAVELTESVLVAEPDQAARMLGALKLTRAMVAMDDFGTGYSNLAALRRLPIDVLKIDRSLVGEMMVDDDKVAIVRAILSLAGALGLKVTAEGVETAELAHLLGALGCATGQGYYFAKPLDREAAYDLASAA